MAHPSYVSLSLCLLVVLLTGSECVKIVKFTVPEKVKNGSESSVVLDCDYAISPENLQGLVIKWYFNKKNLIYQWIVEGGQPQARGPFKGKLNLDYKASDDPVKKHRALQIWSPTTNFSGIYTCKVTTFSGEDERSKSMIVYVPEKSMELSKTEEPDGTVTVKCIVEGVYPEPSMNLTAKERSEVVAEVIPKTRDNVYDIEATMQLKLSTATTFDCILRIPAVNYTVHKTAVYYSVWSTSTPSPRVRSTRPAPATPIILADVPHHYDPDVFFIRDHVDPNSSSWCSPSLLWIFLIGLVIRL